MSERRPPAALIATPAGRDRAIEKLQEHYASGHIELEQLEALLERAERARSDEDLVALFDGLPAMEARALPVVTAPAAPAVRVLLGSVARRGAWRVPPVLRVRALLGAIELDLTEAELSPGETVLELVATLGSITLVVPEGLAVSCEGNALLGSFDHLDAPPTAARDARRIRVVGRAVLGSVDVIVKRRTGALEQIADGARRLLTGR